MSGLADACMSFGRSLGPEELKAKKAMMATLEEDRVRLLAYQPFLASLAMRMDLKAVIDARLPTAATDGQRLYFSVPFMAGLSEAERMFVIAHEVWHCAALHFARRGDRDHKRWNVAIDHEVNNLLIGEGLTMPDGGIHFQEWIGLNAEEVYDRLPSSERFLPGRGASADLHESALDDEADLDEDQPVDPDYTPSPDPRIWREWPRRVHAAAQQVYRQPGNQPGWLKRLLELHGPPALPWQELLRRFVDRTRGERYQWTPPNRRHVTQGLYLPGRRSGERLSLAVAIDTSGSTCFEIPIFMRELNAILLSYGRFEVRLLCCDTRVHFDETFSDERPLPRKLELGGGGGTDLRPVFERLSESGTRALLFMTDGYADIPQRSPNWPVLWCLPSTGQKPGDWGQVLRLPPAVAAD
jgi:predicted metal-dependent peptidase